MIDDDEAFFYGEDPANDYAGYYPDERGVEDSEAYLEDNGYGS